MNALLDPPRRREGFRGTNPQRHPWMLAGAGALPPTLPPDCIVTTGGENPPEEYECPHCRYLKLGVCACGYDWDHHVWHRVEEPPFARIDTRQHAAGARGGFSTPPRR